MAGSDILSQSEIDKLLAALTGDSVESSADSSNTAQTVAVATTSAPTQSFSNDFQDSVEDGDKKGYKLYNFRRPDKFSKEHLRALQDVHKEFARQLGLVLTTYLRLTVNIDVVSVDQLTYDEFTRSMPNPITIGIIEMQPLVGQMLIGVSHEITTSLVDRMLGGKGFSEIKPRDLTDVEEALAKKILDKTTYTLVEAWKNIFPAHGRVVGIDSNYSLIQIVTPGEIVALITLEVQIGSKFSGLLSLCFPYPVLESVVTKLSTQHIFQSKGLPATEEDQMNILSKLNPTSVDLTVNLGEADITLQDFLDLKEGDVLKLKNSVNDSLVLSLNKKKKFYCRPGTLRNKVAISIVEPILDND